MGRQAFPFRSIALTALALTTLTGCVSLGLGGGSGTADAGAGAGAAVAPAAGLNLLEPLGGGLVGRIEGARIGRADRIAALQSEYRALEFTPPGDIVSWQARNGGLTGQVVPSQPYRVGSQDCRQYTHTISAEAASAPIVVRGTACRNPDGSWSLLS
ncbi:MAG: hypothetical protein RIB53_08365 [Roseitalea porphyridii]|jgi:surface antigen|uniref:hypothetical protein n=1 Tax=Roseitalea porphyridii TaxID=1852022 RepID=UPI0032ED2E53